MAYSYTVVHDLAHPFLDFPAHHVIAREQLDSFEGRWISYGRRIDWSAVTTLRVELEMTRFMHTLPYRRIFEALEPVYVVLVCEFLATFELLADSVRFRLGGVERDMSMQEFGIALGVWTPDEVTTTVYTEAIQGFEEDYQAYWSVIALDYASVYQPTSMKATGTSVGP